MIEQNLLESITNISPSDVKLVPIIKKIFDSYQNLTITDECLLSLYFIFDQPLFASLDIIDEKLIKRYTFLPSNRYFYVIEGTKGGKYMCLIDGDYCSCPSFNFSVLLRSESIYCKHQIASFIAEVLKNVDVLEFDDSEYSSKVIEIEAMSFKTPTHKKQSTPTGT
ncbi:hypothetical protein DLAC_03048 [Tieghemostelium lacteum]|uniref:SWIM-type domain-containing protein n=1 Tax=Tieghemostelium lacteum TaxID=361077 RepID=A0A152A239_TIELA|nr:hypothetical protein DLAC_03048 [Tieghemostelium lacteum]|eukprot:KYR00308.1 hypothetical protein DLAC_03048 [Tieghemostelium lacteum]